METKKIISTIAMTTVLFTGCANANTPTASNISIESENSSSIEAINTIEVIPATTATTTTTASGKECDTIMYAISKINVRKEPDSKSEIAFTLYKNDEVNVICMYDNGWYEISKNGNSYYVMGENLSEKEVQETTFNNTTSYITTTTAPSETTVATTTAPITQATMTTTAAITTVQTKPDNSDKINDYQFQIDYLESENYDLNTSISSNQSIIDYYNLLLPQYKSDLEEAKTNLANAKKKKVFVYQEGRGLVQVTDERAVKEAQNTVDLYKSYIDECNSQIKTAKSEIKKAQKQIDKNNKKISNYEQKIAKLS